MENILQGFRVFLLRAGVSEKTIKQYYFWHVEKFFEHTGAKFEEFGDKKKFQRVYDKIILRDITNEGKKKYLKCMRRFADFLLDEEIILENAPRMIKPPKVQTSLPIPVEDSELDNIFLTIQKRWSGGLAYRNKMILLTLLNTGLRRSELIDLRRDLIFHDKVIVKNGKGGKDRIVYIAPWFSSILQEYMKVTDWGSEYLFYSQRREKISIRAMSRIFEEIKKAGDFEKLHAHKMRHTYASRVLECGIGIEVLREQMGHTNIATTNRYIAVRNSHRKQEMRKLDIY